MKIYSFKSNKWILLDSLEASGSKLKIILMNTMKYRKYKIEITPIEATHKHNYLYLGIAWMEV